MHILLYHCPTHFKGLSILLILVFNFFGLVQEDVACEGSGLLLLEKSIIFAEVEGSRQYQYLLHFCCYFVTRP